MEVELEEILSGDEVEKQTGVGEKVVNILFLIILNMVLVAIFNFLTIDSFANFNSRFSAFLLSIFMPFFIVFLTREMSRLERMLKFGLGFVANFVMGMILHGFPFEFLSGLFPVMLIFLTVLYFGRDLIKNWDRE